MFRQPVYMSNSQYDIIVERIRNTYPNSCVLFIDEVVNPELEEKYKEQLKEIKEKRGAENVKEELLFHGTCAENIDSIAFYGFDSSRNVTSAHGRGTYFAKNAIYSKDYMKSNDTRGISYMILAEVIIGNCYTYETNTKINTEKYDNSINSMKNPSIYVTPYQYGAYPKYIIAFHKNATI